ncbi:MAG TPA: hypothetical protein PLK80_13045 [bacterium]|nr:hypothetical protein [bacterium]HPI77653.1 hypothetical protein [bacterium]
MEDNPIERVARFVEEENCFAVMGQLRRLGALSKDDVRRAMGMRRGEWVLYMKEKIGIAGAEIQQEGERNVEKEEA